MSLARKRFIVTVRQKPIRVRGATTDFTDRTFTVFGKTERGVKSSIKNAGISGTIVDIRLG